MIGKRRYLRKSVPGKCKWAQENMTPKFRGAEAEGAWRLSRVQSEVCPVCWARQVFLVDDVQVFTKWPACTWEKQAQSLEKPIRMWTNHPETILYLVTEVWLGKISDLQLPSFFPGPTSHKTWPNNWTVVSAFLPCEWLMVMHLTQESHAMTSGIGCWEDGFAQSKHHREMIISSHYPMKKRPIPWCGMGKR